ncbi:MAG TPA: hypothetical protein VEC57_20205 [Candidatus Limnocylindrales bacterium]|nr:hypothetical protein [Candidatus Limnocylindrales bacterium]
MQPRIQPAQPPYPEDVAAWLAKVMPAEVEPLMLFRTLAVNPRVFGRVMAGGLLDRGSLTLRQRELVIDRTTWRCGSEYEWGVHVAFFGGRAGFGDAEVADICRDDPEQTKFAPEEKLLLRLCDELHESATVSEELWKELAAVYDVAQLVELVVVAGFYHLISFATNAFALAPEPFGARFPEPQAVAAAAAE